MTVTDDMTVNMELDTDPPRLDPGIFELPVPDIRMGYRAAVYFNRTRAIMAKDRRDQIVTMQVFHREDGAIVCGVDEAIAILKVGAGEFVPSPLLEDPAAAFRKLVEERKQIRRARPGIWRASYHIELGEEYEHALKRMATLERKLEEHWVPGWDQLEVHARFDGDITFAWEPVLTITGPYYLFAHLESVYLGILARQTKIATNTNRVVNAINTRVHGEHAVEGAQPKPLLFFADRFDHYATQGGDGYAAKIGGATGFATDAHLSWWGSEATGTMPHALIASYGGDVVAACEAFHDMYPETDLVALVDFNNDCVGDSIKCVKRFGVDLKGVRLDTSAKMVDRSMHEEDMGEEAITGVNPRLVCKVRAALDAHGGKHVRIIVSGGFTAEKIREFEINDVPVDAYAVGSGLLKGNMDFTADVVAPVAKVGRWKRAERGLEKVE